MAITRADCALERGRRACGQLSGLRAIARQATSGITTAPHQAAPGPCLRGFAEKALRSQRRGDGRGAGMGGRENTRYRDRTELVHRTRCDVDMSAKREASKRRRAGENLTFSESGG